MIENENTSQDELADESGVNSAETSRTVSDGISLQEINEIYGTSFKSKDDALKSIKETKNFVGKRKDDIKSEAKKEILDYLKESGISTENFVSKAQLEEEKFYTKNEHLNPYKDIIEATAERLKISRDEVLKQETFKPILEAIGGQKSQNTKSILHSSTMIAPTDTQSAFDKARKTGRLEDWADVLRGMNKEE